MVACSLRLLDRTDDLTDDVVDIDEDGLASLGNHVIDEEADAGILQNLKTHLFGVLSLVAGTEASLGGVEVDDGG